MMQRSPRAVSLALLLFLAGLVTGPATADILVTREGARIKTQGPWKVKGRLIVFTRADGTLSSIRASEVDLEASEAATAGTDEVERKAEAKAERRAPVLVLTDEDVSQVDPEDFIDDPEGEESEGEEEAPAPGLEVSDWQESNLPDGGVSVTGKLRNSGRSVATELRLVVQLYDPNEELIISRLAVLPSSVLNPNQVLDFRADFPDTDNFATVRFDVQNRPFVSTAAGASEQAASAQGAAGAAGSTQNATEGEASATFQGDESDAEAESGGG